ncbi:MAG: thioredoxin family protein [Phycisphaerales bacterium]
MARTPSTMNVLGATAPGFSLLDASTGRVVSLTDFARQPVMLVMFICNHCPFVKHVRAELARLGRDYIPQGVAVVAISSNDAAAYPDDSPELMAAEAKDAGYTFAYLYDGDQSVAKAYRAACTPDFFLYDRARTLAYRGQLDDSRPSKYLDGKVVPVTGRDLRDAIEALLRGERPRPDQKPSLGCNIKWKPGNEPLYYGAGG